MKSLQFLMQKQLQQGGIAVPCGRHSFMEVVEVATGRVWMSVEPATQQDYGLLLKKLDKAFRGVGLGDASMDATLFRHSPNCEGEPVHERNIAGRQFMHVAIPGEPFVHSDGMIQIEVNKFHVVG